jgi:uncharacterized damage-inducible protein DinB
MTSIDVARRLHQHQRWVARKLIEAARPLSHEQLHRSFEIGPGSLWGVLYHLYRAEVLWLGALQGDPSVPEPPVPASLDELAAEWDAVQRRWDEHLLRLTEADLDRQVTRKPVRSPTPLVTSAADAILHAGTHSYYHTAQAVNMLRRLGIASLPETMLIAMSRAEAAERGSP